MLVKGHALAIRDPWKKENTHTHKQKERDHRYFMLVCAFYNNAINKCVVMSLRGLARFLQLAPAFLGVRKAFTYIGTLDQDDHFQLTSFPTTCCLLSFPTSTEVSA